MYDPLTRCSRNEQLKQKKKKKKKLLVIIQGQDASFGLGAAAVLRHVLLRPCLCLRLCSSTLACPGVCCAAPGPVSALPALCRGSRRMPGCTQLRCCPGVARRLPAAACCWSGPCRALLSAAGCCKAPPVCRFRGARQDLGDKTVLSGCCSWRPDFFGWAPGARPASAARARRVGTRRSRRDRAAPTLSSKGRGAASLRQHPSPIRV
jgi:hypothetical protein